MSKSLIAVFLIAALLTVAVIPQSLASSTTASTGNEKITVSQIGNYFLDPRTHPANGGYVGTNPSFQIVNILTKTVSPSILRGGQTATFTIRVAVPAGTTGIVQDFLPFGFTFVAGTFRVDGVRVTPVVVDGRVQFNNLRPGTHTITFQARAPFTFFTFRSFDTARAFIIRNGFIVQFSVTQFLVTVRGTVF